MIRFTHFILVTVSICVLQQAYNTMDSKQDPTRVGIVGFGRLGQFLTEKILESNQFELAFIWNRTLTNEMKANFNEYLLLDINDFSSRNADLIVEVAHPKITQTYGESFLQHADFMCGSPTALANQQVENALRSAAQCHGLYIPTGAFWGGEDIRKMADLDTLKALKVSMTKFPTSFKLEGILAAQYPIDVLASLKQRTVLYKGPVRELCPLAPNNINTMAVASVAAHNLGFDQVQAELVADPGEKDNHLVEIEVWGPSNTTGSSAFHVKSTRTNPAAIGNVTGSATYNSFYSSLLLAKDKGPGVHLC